MVCHGHCSREWADIHPCVLPIRRALQPRLSPVYDRVAPEAADRGMIADVAYSYTQRATDCALCSGRIGQRSGRGAAPAVERLKPWEAAAQGVAALADEDRGVGGSNPGGRGQVAEMEARRCTVAAASTSKHASSAGCGSVTRILHQPAPLHRQIARSWLVARRQPTIVRRRAQQSRSVLGWKGAWGNKELTCEAA